MQCTKCKIKRASATPSLCLPCFKQVAFAWYKFETRPGAFDEDVNRGGVGFKRFCNQTQRRIRQAHKRHTGS